jgi:hypothetical protein
LHGCRTFIVCTSASAILSCRGSNGAEARDATALRDGDDVSVDARDEVVDAAAAVTPDVQDEIGDAAADVSIDAKDEITDATADARDATLPPAYCDSVVWSKVSGSPAGRRITGSGPFDLWSE